MFPISHRSLSTSRRSTDELGSRLERPIHFECKLNEPMHIGMRLLHPAAADHSVSISRQQVQRIFSFSLRSRGVFIVLFLTYPSVPSSLWCWCTALQRWWSPVVEWVAHIRLHYPLLCCCDHLPCTLQHAKRAKLSLKELHGWNVFLKTRLLKDVLPPVRFWVRSLPGAGWGCTSGRGVLLRPGLFSSKFVTHKQQVCCFEVLVFKMNTFVQSRCVPGLR